VQTSPSPLPGFGPRSGADLRALAKEHDAGALEAALIRRLVELRPRYRPRHNELLLRVIEGSREADEALAAREIAVLTLGDLVRAFEVLAESGGGPGSVFTPEWVAQLLVGEAVTAGRRDGRVVDPACGCGALLVAALYRIHALHRGKRSAASIVAEQVFGADIDPGAVRRAQLLLVLGAVDLGSDVPELGNRANFAVRDSLDPAGWASEEGRFDVVVGNPPYVRYHQLDAARRQTYREAWSVLAEGNYNLYYAFFELAQRLRAPGGGVAYITPNSYFRAASGRALRRWMLDEVFPTKIIDYGGAAVFPGALTYTAVTISDPAPRDATVRPRLRYADASGRVGNPQPPDDSSFAVVELAGLGDGPWALVGSTHRRAVANASSGGRALTDVADMRFGVATLRDRLYLLSGDRSPAGNYVASYDGRCFEIEPEATVPAVRVSSVASQAELDSCPTRLLFPYTRDGAGRAVVWSDDELAAHPKAQAYLNAIAGELARRDRGRKRYAAWFAYGRTQGLAAWSGARLLTPLYGARPRFLLDTTAGRLFLNGCAITPRPDSGVSVDLLGALLNSGVLHYFVEQTSSPINGGYYSYQKGPLGAFHIRDEALAREGEILVAGPERQRLIASIYRVELPSRYLGS